MTSHALRLRLCLLLIALSGAEVGAQTAQAWGVPLREHRSLPTTEAIRLAVRAVAEAPDDRVRVIELARAQAGARQMREAIATLSRGIERWPDAAELYRWRGHRYLSVRELDRALTDFDRGLALDSAVYGIWYHLGIVRFVRGEFDAAARAFIRARPLAPDSAEAAGSADWLWMSLARGTRFREAAAVLAGLPAFAGVDNAYTRRLKLYRGDLQPETMLVPADTADTQVATLAFGIGNWLLAQGDTTGARTWFHHATQTTGWPAFGFIAAEADEARLVSTYRPPAIGGMFPHPPEFDPPDAARVVCLARLPEELTHRVLVRATLHLAGPPPPGLAAATRAMGVALDEAAARFRAQFADEPGELPQGEPEFHWMSLTGVLDVLIRRDGSFTTRVVRIDSTHPARRGTALLALEQRMVDVLRTAEWTRQIPVDSLRFRVAISVPMVGAGWIADTVLAYSSAPLMSVRVPSATPAREREFAFFDYPYRAWMEGLEGAFTLSFTLDTVGRVYSESVQDNWPANRPRLRGAEGEAYYAFLREARRAVQMSTWYPSDLGGCRGPHRMEQDFLFSLERRRSR